MFQTIKNIFTKEEVIKKTIEEENAEHDEHMERMKQAYIRSEHEKMVAKFLRDNKI